MQSTDLTHVNILAELYAEEDRMQDTLSLITRAEETWCPEGVPVDLRVSRQCPCMPVVMLTRTACSACRPFLMAQRPIVQYEPLVQVKAGLCCAKLGMIEAADTHFAALLEEGPEQFVDLFMQVGGQGLSQPALLSQHGAVRLVQQPYQHHFEHH